MFTVMVRVVESILLREVPLGSFISTIREHLQVFVTIIIMMARSILGVEWVDLVGDFPPLLVLN